MKQYHGVAFHVMLIKLNQLLRGWAYAHRQSVAKRLFSMPDNDIFELVCRWLRKAHRNKTWAWIAKHYRKRINGRWQFSQLVVSPSNIVKGTSGNHLK